MAPPENPSGGSPEGTSRYDNASEKDLVKEVEQRIDAGRNLDLSGGTSQEALVAALVADDQAAAEETKPPIEGPAAEASASDESASEGEYENTSGRPELADLAVERAENRNPRVIETAQEEE